MGRAGCEIEEGAVWAVDKTEWPRTLAFEHDEDEVEI
jgi:hypothetical protein